MLFLHGETGSEISSPRFRTPASNLAIHRNLVKPCALKEVVSTRRLWERERERVCVCVRAKVVGSSQG